MVNLILLIVRMVHEFFQLSCVLPGFCEVERSEILIEAIVLKILNGRICTLSMLK